MSRPRATIDVDLLLEHVRNGRGLETAAELVGACGRTVLRPQRDDPAFAAAVTAARAEAAASRVLRRDVHGTVASYQARRCRCADCCRANTERCRRTRQRRRLASAA